MSMTEESVSYVAFTCPGSRQSCAASAAWESSNIAWRVMGGGESAFEVRDFEEGIRRQDFGKRLARDVKELEEIFVPLSCLEIQELCPAGVRGDLYRVRRYRLRS